MPADASGLARGVQEVKALDEVQIQESRNTPMATNKKSLVNNTLSTKPTKSSAEKASTTAPAAASLKPTMARLQTTMRAINNE
jgi:hypothetical protein